MKPAKRISLSKIEGTGGGYERKFREQGITTVDSFLDYAASPRGRQQLARQVGISEKLLLEWTNLADLMRIDGVGEEYGQLLEAAGVDSPDELANCRPDDLHQKMEEVNLEKNLVRRVPSLVQLEVWIEQAKQLEPVVTQ